MQPMYTIIRKSFIAIMSGISNIIIKKFVNEGKNDDLKTNFVGVFPSHNILRFISFHRLIKEKYASYPFLII